MRDGDKPTKECFVFGILPSRQAIKSSRVFDGRSYSDILNMTYSDLQMLLEFYDIQDVKEITYDFGTYTRTDFYYYYESKSSDDLFGYRVGIAYEFLIYTKKDDRIIDFEIKERGDLWLEHDANVWTLSDLDSEEVLNTIQEESRYMQDSIEGYIFATYNEDSRSGYDTVLFCITRTAGFPYNEEGYVVHEFEQPANTVDGFDADYSMIDIYGDIYKTLPEAIEFAESRMEDCSVVWSTFTP